MNKSKEILVSIMMGANSFTVGTLWFHNRKGRQSASFEYKKEWLTNPDRFALEPALTLAEGAFHTNEGQLLFGAIGAYAHDGQIHSYVDMANALQQYGEQPDRDMKEQCLPPQ